MTVLVHSGAVPELHLGEVRTDARTANTHSRTIYGAEVVLMEFILDENNRGDKLQLVKSGYSKDARAESVI